MDIVDPLNGVSPGDPPLKLDKKTQRPLARPGDPTPPKPYRFKDVCHSTLHFNQKIGQLPLLKLPAEKWCICVLHMHLAIVGMIFKKSVLEDNSLGSLMSGGRSEGTLAHGLFLLLKAAGVHLKLPHAPENDVNKFYHSISKHKFAGADASKLLAVWPQVMQLVFPDSRRKGNKPLQERYDNHCHVWKFWADQLWPLIQNTDIDRTQKANQLQSKAIEFVTLWVNATGGTQNLYLHLLVKHLPEQVRPGTPLSMPCDPWFLQTQSLESKHSFRKKIHLNRTNKHAPKPPSNAYRLSWSISVETIRWRATSGRVASAEVCRLWNKVSFMASFSTITSLESLKQLSTNEQMIAGKPVTDDSCDPRAFYLRM
jgi:hypothetical protein